MKRSLAVLFMMMLVVSILFGVEAQEIVPVYLSVPEFVRLSIDESDPDGQFDLVFDFANPDATLQDTVKLLAEANVDYTITYQVYAIIGYQGLLPYISISIDTSGSFGEPGSWTFDTTATMDPSGIIDNLDLGTLTNKHIAQVYFTISSN